jgi:hypothetical protein
VICGGLEHKKAFSVKKTAKFCGKKSRLCENFATPREKKV